MEPVKTDDQTAETPLIQFNYASLDLLKSNPACMVARPGLTPELKEKLLQEERFYMTDTSPMPALTTREDCLAVGMGTATCSLCDGTKHIWRKHAGFVTGVEIRMPVACMCRQYTTYFKQWMNPERVPPAWRDCTMRNLMNGTLRNRFPGLTNDQLYTIIACIHAFPFYSMVISGTTGHGKTTLLTALFDYALHVWAEASYKKGITNHAVWKIDANQLAAEQRDYARLRDDDDNPPKLPTVTPELVATAAAKNLRPALFLDEFDKFSTTEFQKDSFFAVINAVVNFGGQVVLCTNYDLPDMVNKLGAAHGEPMLRRLIDMPRGIYIDMRNKQVFVNRILHRAQLDEATKTWSLVAHTNATKSVGDLAPVQHDPPAQKPIYWDKFVPGNRSNRKPVIEAKVIATSRTAARQASSGGSSASSANSTASSGTKSRSSGRPKGSVRI